MVSFFSNADLLRKAFHFGAFNVVNILIGLVSISVLLNQLSLEDIGYIGLYQSITTILPRVIGLGSTSFVVSQAVRSSKMRYRITLSVLLFWMVFLTAIMLCIGIPLVFYFGAGVVITVYLAGIVSSFNYTLFNLHSAFLIQSSKPLIYGYYKSGSLLITLLITMFVFKFVGGDFYSRIFSVLIVDVCFIGLRIYIFRRFFSFNFNLLIAPEFRVLAKYGIPVIMTAGSGWFFFDFDKVLISTYYDPKTVGLLTSALWIGALISQINELFRQVFTPKIRGWCEYFSFHGLVRIYFAHLFLLAICGVSLIVAMGLLSDYIEIARQLASNPFVLYSTFFYVLFSSFTSLAIVLEYFGESKYRMIFMFIFALGKIVLSLLFIINGQSAIEVYMLTIFFYLCFVVSVIGLIWQRRSAFC